MGIIITTVLVSDAIEDLILGIDWLTSHHCKWDFGNQWIEVEGYGEKLTTQPSRRLLRKIYVAEDVNILVGQQVHVPVLVTWPDLRAEAGC